MVEAQESGQSGPAEEAALVDGCQDGHLIMAGATKGPTLVQMNWKRIVAKQAERLVVMPVHVARQKVEDR